MAVQMGDEEPKEAGRNSKQKAVKSMNNTHVSLH